MLATTHLKSLQALELAIRTGSLKAAAERLGITPAAVGQRVRALEDYLGTDLLMRGRSGLQPTPELTIALGDLGMAFAALERVTETLDFQRVSEIQIVADPDWAELWLEPRLPAFREAHPNIMFCINGAGDAPLRLGVPDVRVTYGDGPDETLFTDVFLPLTGPDNLRRLRRIEGGDSTTQMEGMPLLHLRAQGDTPALPGWVDWFEKFGQRVIGQDRGVRYAHMRLALEAVRLNVGFLLGGLSLVGGDLDNGLVVNPFPLSQHLVAPHPYRMKLRHDFDKRPQLQRFVSWLRNEAGETRRHIEAAVAKA
jgi:LysR family transcriptional regulator, glycine cleavage system transcriptional activator